MEDIWENTGIRVQVVKEICDLAQKYNIERVLLFGSRARGDYRKVSDIDLAAEGGDVNGFTLAVDEETSTLLEYDIVNLGGSVQGNLMRSIMEEGKLLYENSPCI